MSCRDDDDDDDRHPSIFIHVCLLFFDNRFVCQVVILSLDTSFVLELSWMLMTPSQLDNDCVFFKSRKKLLLFVESYPIVMRFLVGFFGCFVGYCCRRRRRRRRAAFFS